MSRHVVLRSIWALAFAALASAGSAGPADQARARIAAFRDLGTTFKLINDTLRSPQPQIAIVQRSAVGIHTAGQRIYG